MWLEVLHSFSSFPDDYEQTFSRITFLVWNSDRSIGVVIIRSHSLISMSISLVCSEIGKVSCVYNHCLALGTQWTQAWVLKVGETHIPDYSYS